MIKNYMLMKKNEWKIKALLYGTIASILDNQEEILELFRKMYVALKDVPTDKLQEELISKLVEFIHGSTE